jgi:TonB-linked SusC/RagA family outer membrane protein
MINSRNRFIALLVVVPFCILGLYAQSTKVSGCVVDPYTKKPIAGAIVSSSNGEKSATTDNTGIFIIELQSTKGELSAWAPGYYTNTQAVLDRATLPDFILIPENKFGYADKMVLPFRGVSEAKEKSTNSASLQKSNLDLGDALAYQTFNRIAGLKVTEKSGMPGEGATFNFRGISSLSGEGTPLVVVNGVPYLPDMNQSVIINGYSRDILAGLNAYDISNISFLKGSDASLYGSMGSNGVIMIETDKAVDMDTKVQFMTQTGISMNQSTMPVMGVHDYKAYIGDITKTWSSDLSTILSAFHYLENDPTYKYNYLYNNDTNWQKKIYQTGFETEDVLKIKGGDAIAKYDLSIGYLNQGGQVIGTNYSKYNVRLNSDVNLSRKLTFSASLGMTYSKSVLQEQGMSEETNPLLAALHKGPIFSPYEKDASNNLSSKYAAIKDDDGNVIVNDSVSNPVAIVNEVEAKATTYNILMNGGLTYKWNEFLKLNALLGLFYDYNREQIFIPGVTDMCILPVETGADNTVRESTGNKFNVYANINGTYDRTFNRIHAISALAGVQMTTTTNEVKAAKGINTTSDFYQSLSYVNAIGMSLYGYSAAWNWLNMYAGVNYKYDNQFSFGVNLSADGSSSVGDDTHRFTLYPSVNGAWFVKNTFLKNIDWLNNLKFRLEYATTGNSRFASSLSKYIYVNQRFRQLTGIVIAGVSNTQLTAEISHTVNVGVDASFWNNRISVSFDAYRTRINDLIVPQSVSPVLGADYIYQNAGKMQNQGVEASVQVAPVFTKKIKWDVGFTIARNSNKLISLGSLSSYTKTLSDGSAVISEVGKSAYCFYGLQTAGVFSTTAEAKAANLKNSAGSSYGAGDIHFVDQNGDGVIDSKDKVNLGNPNPKFFGNFFTNIQYKNVELAATFSYSYGNKAYNAVRRNLESMTDFSNQLVSVTNRWTQEGDVTSMPKATYGDPMGNSQFSDRWIEDASYIKLKQLTLSYTTKFFSVTTFFVTGENIFTITKYLGLDPEIAYSYDSMVQGFDYAKIPKPLTVRIGVKVNL